MTHSIETKVLALTLALALLLSGCGSTAVSDPADPTAAPTTLEAAFTFSDSGISAPDGTGYTIDGTALTISAPGTYTLTGACSDGSVTVKKGTTGVTLVLSGLDLTSATTAPITCGKSTEVTIEAAAGTVNTLTDSAENNDETYPDNTAAENAVIKCKDGSQVTLCGTGTVRIAANGKNGIKSGATTDTEGAASLTIRELTLEIDAAVNDAINAEQLLNIASGTLTLSAADDAIHSDLELNIGAEGTAGPTIAILKSEEGIEAATLNVRSGDLSILSTDDCMNAANSDLSGYAFTMTISGGTIYAFTTGGDGFDSNGSLTISGGTVAVWTANASDNQPLDADGTVTISGGTVLAAGGSGGMGMKLTAAQPCVTFGSGATMGGRGFGGKGDFQPPETGDRQPPEMTGTQLPEMGDRERPEMGGREFPEVGDRQSGGTATALIASGSSFNILDADGNALFTDDAPCQAGYVFFSSPALTEGGAYTLTADGTEVATAVSE